MRMRNESAAHEIRSLLASSVVAAVLVFPAFAGEVSYQANIPESKLSWKKYIYVPKFNPSDGILESVRIDFIGWVRGDIKLENKSSKDATVISTLKAQLTLEYPSGVIGSVQPELTYTDYLGPFDGTVDYAYTSQDSTKKKKKIPEGSPPSGIMHNRKYAEQSATFTTSNPDDLDLFNAANASDMISLRVSASGRSTATGAGNLAASFRTEAGATIVVTYVYRSEETPPPSDEVCTRTPGYWKNHPEAWPVDSIIISNGESTDKYEQGRAIDIMQLSTSGDMSYSMFEHYVAAYLNVAPYLNSQSTLPACVSEALAAAANWLIEYPPGSGVSASDDAWVGSGQGELVKNLLDDYNNGRLCAPHCD